MQKTYTYAVSYLRGRDEAWVARFLDDLDSRLNAVSPVRFVRWATAGGPGQASPGVATADRVVVLCSPAYFNEGPADADWAVLSHRMNLERARGWSAPTTVLPVLWEPMSQRLPDVVAEADTFTAEQPPEYRSLGLALMTMQAARHRGALDRVLDNLTRRLAAVPEGGPTTTDFPDELPRALASDDARFTELFRGRAADAVGEGAGRPLIARRLRRQDGSSERGARSADMAAAGRRLLLIGPAGSGRSVELRALAHRVLSADGDSPWDCQVAFRLSAATEALPSLDGFVPLLAPTLAAREPAGWAARQLRGGRALLAVDGLDRAPAHLRPAAWEWLLRTAETFPQAVCVVESNGTSVPWHRVSGIFTPVFLAPLAPDERAALLAPDDPATGAGMRRDPGLAAGNTGAAGRSAAGPRDPILTDDPLLKDAVAWPSAAIAVRRAADRATHHRPGRLELLDVAVAAAWRPETEAAKSRNQVRDSVLRAAAGGLASATLATGDATVPVGAALNALADLSVGGPAGPVPFDRLYSQLADRAGLLYAPAAGTVAFPSDAVRQFLAAEHLAAHPGPDTDRIVAAHTRRTGSRELAMLVAGLSAPRESVVNVPGLLESGGGGRRLTATTTPAPALDSPHVVRTLDDLWRLSGDEAVTEVWCQGPVAGLEDGLPELPGLRTLVISDHPHLPAVPDLSRCDALRSLRLVNCPGVRDVEALANSALMFLAVSPWRESFDLAPLGRARWLRRVDLAIADGDPDPEPDVDVDAEPDVDAGPDADRTSRVGRVEVRRHAMTGRTRDPSRP